MNNHGGIADSAGVTESGSPPPSLKRRFLSLPTLVAFGVALAFIFFLAARFDLDWGETWDRVRGMNPWLYAAGFALYYISFGFRGFRWRVLARNAAARASPGATIPSTAEFSQIILVGWFVNAIAWLRLGDAYRAYGLSQRSGNGFSWSLGTIVAERVMDMATVLTLVFVAAVSFSASSDSNTATYILAAVSVMAAALGALLALMRAYGTRVARFLPGRLGGAYLSFQLGTLGSFKQLPLLFVLGLAGWLLEIGRLYFVVQALGLDASLPLITLAALGHALLSTVPTPGGLGVVEPGLTGLLVLELPRGDAASVVLLDRSITYVSVIVTGGLLFLLRQVAQARAHRPAPAPVESASGHEADA